MSRTSVHSFFLTCHVLITWFELSRVKLYRNDLKADKDYFELAGGSSYRGFELLRVNYTKCMKEIQGKSTLVRVIGNQLYFHKETASLKFG